MSYELNSFEVNGHTYKYRSLNPMDALDFGSRVAKLLAPALSDGSNLSNALANMSKAVDVKDMKNLIKEALGYCYTPKSEALDNEAVFNAWFTECPEDLFEAGIKAVYNLVIPFLPKTLLTTIDTSSFNQVEQVKVKASK